ncbi:MAG TPA: hypothetical protein VIL74_08415 [Pyrinomonadaceae bacterium]|jgi:DNA-directed RNA polymerase subunit RPC12/RpoP
MISKKYFVWFFIILCAVNFVSAQDAREEQRRKAEAERLRQEDEKRLQEQYKAALAARLRAPDLSGFVPAEPDAWLIGTIVRGGWARTTEISGTVKSDGNFLCREENLAIDHRLAEAQFEAISNFVKKTDFGEIFPDQSLNLGKKVEPSECPECSSEILVVARRLKKNKIRTYEFRLENYPAGDSSVNKLFDLVKNSAACPRFIK